jgi:hypothetical protein
MKVRRPLNPPLYPLSGLLVVGSVVECVMLNLRRTGVSAADGGDGGLDVEVGGSVGSTGSRGRHGDQRLGDGRVRRVLTTRIRFDVMVKIVY